MNGAVQPEPTACPGCDADDARTLFEGGNPHLCIVRCRACGLMYQNPRIPEVSLEDAHALLPEYADYGALHAAKTEIMANRLADWLHRSMLPRSGLMLDFGAGLGPLADAQRRALPAWDYFALEPSPSARQQLESRGLKTLRQLPDANHADPFDFVQIDNVLEHLPTPRQTLSEIRRSLQPNGLCYIEVPNESWFRLRRRINDFARGYPKAPTFPGHLTLFTKRTLHQMLETTGWKIVAQGAVSISANHRIGSVLPHPPSLRLRAILSALRWTGADLILNAAYWTWVLATPSGAVRER